MDNSSGKLGEEEVAKFLEQKGYSILQKIYRKIIILDSVKSTSSLRTVNILYLWR